MFSQLRLFVLFFSFLSLCFIVLNLFFPPFKKFQAASPVADVSQRSEVRGQTIVNDLKKEISPTQHVVSDTESLPKVDRRSISIGFWTEGFWDDSSKTLHPEILVSLEKTINKKVAIAHYFRGWDALDSEAFRGELGKISENGWIPMVSANPYFFDRCEARGVSLYRAIAEGHCDEFLERVGENLKEFSRGVFLRFAWEMNAAAVEWSVLKTGDSARDFVDAWRRFHDIVGKAGAENVKWVFSPNADSNDPASLDNLYPGDAYVDWIGIDGYNWGTTQSWSSWRTFSQVFGATYSQLVKIAPSKPVMIAEVNTTDKGGNKSLWYQNMLSTELPSSFPKVEAVVFYNEDRTRQENVDWRIDVSAASLNSFRESLQSPIYSP